MIVAALIQKCARLLTTTYSTGVLRGTAGVPGSGSMVSGVLRVGAGVILGYPRVRILSGIRLRLRDATLVPPRWWCRSGQRMRQNTYFPASYTRKNTPVPTPVPCCSAMPYRTLTLLPPPPPPRSPPDDCVLACAACGRNIQNQDFSFDPPRTPLRYTPLSFAAGGRGGGQIPNAMCVKNNYPMMKPVGRRSERV